MNPLGVSRSLFTRSILDTLRMEIVTGALAPGERVTESKLAIRFEVSRGPVRDALLILEHEGLVRSLSRGATEVTGFSTEDVDHLFDVRFHVEQMACNLLMAMDDADLSPLNRTVEQMKGESVSSVVADLDMQFHSTLVALAQNRFLLLTWDVIAPIVGVVLRLTNMMWDLPSIREKHDELQQALADKDQVKLDRLVREHMERPRIFMKKFLLEGNPSDRST